jgi:dolichyl-diphosphooligosaccharide--protein glycosyltransferase
VPVLLGVLSIIVIYFLAREIFNERIALYSSLILAVLPAHAQISFLGFTDHHAAEVLLSALAYLFFIRALKNKTLFTAAISGIFIGLSFLTWTGAPIFAGVILTYAVTQLIIDRRIGTESNYLIKAGTISFICALLVVSFFYLWTPWQRTITQGMLSYFHLLYLAASAGTVLFLGKLAVKMKSIKWYYYPILLVLISVIIILGIFNFFPAFYSSLLNGIGYLFRDTPVMKQIVEAQPLFYSTFGKFLGFDFFSNPVWFVFRLSFYTGIVGIMLLLLSLRSMREKEKIFLLIWTLITLALTLSQRRFSYSLAANMAIFSGYFIEKTSFYLSNIYKFKAFNLKSDYVALFILAVIVIPNISGSYISSQEPPKPSDDWYDSLIWLKDNTNDTGQYGIMAMWDYGNWILYISKRPVVANNFQLGADDAVEFLLSDNETKANTIMDKRKAKYVIVDRRTGLNRFIQDDKIILTGTFFSLIGLSDGNTSAYLDENNLPNIKYFMTMYARLHVFNGNELKNYRLIYESNETFFDIYGKSTSNIKIFEYVPGAAIIGNGTFGEEISISGTIMTNQKRITEYVQRTKVDKDGHFKFTVPYSRDSPYETRLLNDYRINYSNSEHLIDPLEKDIINGNSITVV